MMSIRAVMLGYVSLELARKNLHYKPVSASSNQFNIALSEPDFIENR
jgi:hypothetical protein